jgi:hypothetical protein
MEEAAFCTMLVLNVGPYRKQLRFRGVHSGKPRPYLCAS